MANRILVCGGRDYADHKRLYSVLSHYHASNPFSVLIHGAARGADSLASEWAEWAGIPVLPFEADWDDLETRPRCIKRRRNGGLYNAAAGGIRNARMLVEGRPDVVIAFPGGPGTADMCAKAETANVPVLRIPNAP